MILLLSPLPMELHPLLQLFPFQETGNILFGKGYRTISSDNENLVIEACTTGMGKVHSAVTTVAVLERSVAAKRKIDCAVLLGIGGAASKESIGDLLIASETIQWDLELQPGRGRIGIYPDGGGIEYTDERLSGVIHAAMARADLAAFSGTSFTGDRFLYSERRDSITSPGVVDMESAAVLTVLNRYAVPSAVLRLVSDTVAQGRPKNLRNFIDDRLPNIWRAVVTGALTFSQGDDIVP